MTDGELILATGALLAGGLAISLLAGRIRLPGLVLVLGLGMLIGTDGLGWLDFGDVRLARTIGVIALGLILFEGGVAAGLPEIRPVLGPAVSLAVAGTLATAVIAGLAAAALFGLSTKEGLLLGSVLASTDGAATFALLRGSTLRRRLALTLEGEAGLNDPVAILLVLVLIALIATPGYGALDVAGLVARELGIGLAVGAAMAGASVLALGRVRLSTPGLYPVASVAAAAIAYGGADALHGSGFLAVYLTGLGIGSVPTPAQRTIAAFHDGLAWIAQLVLFLVLGLLVFPSQLGDVAVKGTALALVVAFLARPAGTLLATVGFGFSLPERLVLGWAGLRGAVPVVLATYPVIAGVAHAAEFFNIVFFAVLLSAILQGASFEAVARRLGVTSGAGPPPQSSRT